MRWAVAALILICAGTAVAVLSVRGRGGDDDSAYRVRAVFDTADFVAKAEDVKVAGAVVGEIESLSLTRDRKAVVNLKIDDRRFTPFRSDAVCSIRSEGLLAVKFVECDPGTRGRPPLRVIRGGDGTGRSLLPVTNTSAPIDLDLVTNIMREPRGRELALLLSELGVGLAGRTSELNAVIHRANPALRMTNRVLAVLARENRDLADLARSADRVLTPLAAQRREVARFITSARPAFGASASQSAELARTLDRLPGFLRELRPSMAAIGELSDQAAPVLAQLSAAAPELGRGTSELRGFVTAGRPALRSVGTLSVRAREDIPRLRPLVRDLSELGSQLRPASTDLDRLTASLRRNSAVRHAMDLFFYGTSAVNGFDDVGHYARLEGLSSACSEYTAKGFFGCDAQWGPARESAKPIADGRAVDASGPDDQLLEYLLAP